MPRSPVLVLRPRLTRWYHQAESRAPTTMQILIVSPGQAAEAARVLAVFPEPLLRRLRLGCKSGKLRSRPL